MHRAHYRTPTQTTVMSDSQTTSSPSKESTQDQPTAPQDSTLESEVDELLDSSAQLLDECRSALEEVAGTDAVSALDEDPEEESESSTVDLKEVDDLIAQSASDALEADETTDSPSQAPSAQSQPEAERDEPPTPTQPAPSSEHTDSPTDPAPPDIETKPSDQPRASEPVPTAATEVKPGTLGIIIHHAQSIGTRAQNLPLVAPASRITRKALGAANGPWETCSPMIKTILLTVAGANVFMAFSALMIALWRVI